MRSKGRSTVARGAVLAGVTVFVAMGAAACGTASAPAGSAPSAAASASPQRGVARSAAPAPGPGTPAGPGTSAGPDASPSPASPAGPGSPAYPEKVDCPGWPSAAAEALPPSFTPVSVLRCVTGNTTVPGKGEWLTATLEQASNQDLTPLDRALRAANGQRQAGRACPLYLAVPPQIALVGADGTKIRARFPVTGCGQIQPQVTAALNALRWHTVSRRLVAPAGQ